MKNLILTITLAFLILAALNAPKVAAETVYVDDNQNLVWIRTGPTKEYRVLPPIPPHTKLEALQVNEETGYTQVRDVTGREFWVESKFLTREATTKHQLASALQKIQRLESQHKNKVTSLEKRISELSPLETNNEDLLSKIAQLESDLDQASQKAHLYEGGFDRDAYFTGAVIVLSGMFLGWLLTRLGGGKRNSGWS